MAYVVDKLAMYKYLKNYAGFLYTMVANPDISAEKAFVRYMVESNQLENCNREYYKIMCRVASIFSSLKNFSLVEDYYLNGDRLISDESLKRIRDIIKEEGFIYEGENLSSIELVKAIRNCFNHNTDNSNCSYTILDKARYIEIVASDIRNEKEKKAHVPKKAVHIKLTPKALLDMTKVLVQNAQAGNIISIENDDFDFNAQDLHSELDKVKLNTMCSSKKLDFNALSKIKAFTEGMSTQELSNEYTNLVGKANINKARLTTKQKSLIVNKIQKIRNSSDDSAFKFVMNNHPRWLLNYLVEEVLPLPVLKAPKYFMQAEYPSILEEYSNTSFNDYRRGIRKNMLHLYNTYRDEAFTKEDETRYFNSLATYLDTIDSTDYLLYPFVNCMDYYVCNCMNDSNIKVNDERIKKAHLRNSFTHSRWYSYQNGTRPILAMFDSNVRNEAAFALDRLKFIGSFEINSLYRSIDDNYSKSLQGEEKSLKYQKKSNKSVDK